MISSISCICCPCNSPGYIFIRPVKYFKNDADTWQTRQLTLILPIYWVCFILAIHHGVIIIHFHILFRLLSILFVLLNEEINKNTFCVGLFHQFPLFVFIVMQNVRGLPQVSHKVTNKLRLMRRPSLSAAASWSLATLAKSYYISRGSAPVSSLATLANPGGHPPCQVMPGQSVLFTN